MEGTAFKESDSKEGVTETSEYGAVGRELTEILGLLIASYSSCRYTNPSTSLFGTVTTESGD
jgi:hypothetical protein